MTCGQSLIVAGVRVCQFAAPWASRADGWLLAQTSEPSEAFTAMTSASIPLGRQSTDTITRPFTINGLQRIPSLLRMGLAPMVWYRSFDQITAPSATLSRSRIPSGENMYTPSPSMTGACWKRRMLWAVDGTACRQISLPLSASKHSKVKSCTLGSWSRGSSL